MSSAETTNSRIAPRLRTLKGANLVLANRLSYRCTVRNTSPTGVCVEMPSTLAVPSRVTLKLDDGSPSRLCDIAWRTETRLGLRFAD